MRLPVAASAPCTCGSARSAARPNQGPRGVARFYAKECGWPKSVAKKLMGKRHPPRTPRRALTPQELLAYNRAVSREPEPLRTLLLLLPLTGLRVSEVVRLRCRDIQGGRLHAFGKGSKWRWVPLSADAKRLIGALTAALARAGASGPDAALFPGQGARGTVATSTVQAGCRRAGLVLGLDIPLTPHILRHTYATRAVAACVPPADVQAALGHDKFTTTLTYLHGLIPKGATA